MEENETPYIEIRFYYSVSYIYLECVGLAKRISGFKQVGNNTDICNILLYTCKQVKEYDPFFDALMERVFRLRSTKVFYMGIEVDRCLLNNLKWQHNRKEPQLFGKPLGIYEEFIRKN